MSNYTNSRTEPAAARARTKENPRNLYATGFAGFATLVRGSSRRIKIMRFRPANIRLINRRSNMLRLLLALSSRKTKATATTKTTPQIRRGGQGQCISVTGFGRVSRRHPIYARSFVISEAPDPALLSRSVYRDMEGIMPEHRARKHQQDRVE
jgi:hypothetical protein